MEKQKTPQQMFEEKQRKIDKAINQKERDIAFMNATNSAIRLVTAWKPIEGNKELIQAEIRFWREWFYSQWQEWIMQTTEPELPEEEKAF